MVVTELGIDTAGCPLLDSHLTQPGKACFTHGTGPHGERRRPETTWRRVVQRRSLLSSAFVLALFSLAGCDRDDNPVEPTIGDQPSAPSFITAGNTWTVRAPLRVPRAGLKATAVNGIIYAIGGHSGPSQIRSTVEAYNPTTNSWIGRSKLPEPLQPFGATTLNGKIYVAGGYLAAGPSKALYVYDPSINRWSRKASLPYWGRFGALEAAINGQLYVYLGLTTNPDGTVGPQRFLRYNPSTDRWSSLKVPSFARVGGASTVFNGRLYIMGGKLPKGDGVTGQAADVHVYSPVTNSWIKQPLSPGGYYSTLTHAYASPRGKMYLTGADYEDGWNHRDLVYDPATNTVATISEPHYARNAAAGAAVGGLFYAIGGYTCQQAVGTIEPCDPSDLSGAVEAYSP
jgi:N-acetylneuraminic acid mutarotase